MSTSLSDSIRASLIMKDINLIKNDVNDLKRDISLLFRQKTPSIVPSTCHICIVFPETNPITVPLLDTEGVSKLLGCPALSVVKVNRHTFKVKIPKVCLHTALLSSSSISHSVRVWRNKLSKPFHMPTASPPQSQVTQVSSVSIVTWNCRGLHNSVPTFSCLCLKMLI